MMRHGLAFAVAALVSALASGQAAEMMSDSLAVEFLAGKTGLSRAQAPEPVTITVGDAKFHMISDGRYKPGALLASDMFPGVLTQDNIDEHFPGDMVDLSFGVTLLQHKGENFLFDSSCGLFFNKANLEDETLFDLRDILKNKFNLNVPDINFVIHSHLHLDHIGWNVVNDLDENGTLTPTFTNAKHVVQHVDWLYWGSTEATKARTKFDTLLQPLADANMMQFVDNNTDFTPNLKFIKRLGHTPGHQVLRFEKDGEIVYYIGDGVHTLPQLEHPEWSPMFDWDPHQAAITRRAMLEEIASERAMLISPHFPFPGYGYLSPKGNGWRLVKEKPSPPSPSPPPPDSGALIHGTLLLPVLIAAVGAIV